jgi:flagellar basal body-associated protein FliL
MGYFLNFIIISIIVIWVLRLLVRLIFPVMLKKAFGNMQNQATGNQQQRQQQYQSTKPEGSISIDYMPKKEKKGNADKLGDFVDYEEVK